PRILHSDNANEIVSLLIHEFMKLSTIDHRLITAYYPQANGLAKASVKRVKTTLFKLLEDANNTWDSHI
ncbi:hypothetical protein BC833DRAFT_508329, partial [Globomyces pollinis-pini]